ncbi:T-box transcription factor TBX19 [Taenia crassiceps]|uniref:T-box transcription factor TBX19 n=1 Tax=Taenia crassiceps TaxID=6207 RepID=A0ABR4Q160_9CEST
MANTGDEGKGCDREKVPAEAVVSDAAAKSKARESYSFLPANVDEEMYTALLAIARSVPYVWPADLRSDREKFSSICIAGVNFDPSNSTKPPTITLRLCDMAIWRETEGHIMEMRTRNRIFPTLTVNVEGLKADEKYTFFLDLMPKDKFIHSYQLGRWYPRVPVRPYPPANQDSLLYVPLEALKLGSTIMASGVDFSSAKITTDIKITKNSNQIFVYNLQIYLPRYHITDYVESSLTRSQKADYS